jgi:hypothetical protein
MSPKASDLCNNFGDPMSEMWLRRLIILSILASTAAVCVGIKSITIALEQQTVATERMAKAWEDLRDMATAEAASSPKK